MIVLGLIVVEFMRFWVVSDDLFCLLFGFVMIPIS